MVFKILFNNHLEGEILFYYLDNNGYEVSIERSVSTLSKTSAGQFQNCTYVMDAATVRKYIINDHEGTACHLRIIVVGKLEHLYIPFTCRFNRVAYVTKMDSITEMLHGIKAFRQKKIYVSRRVFGFLNRKRVEQQTALIGAKIQKSLTKTELEILQEIGREKTTREIADEWNRSIHTINNHRKNIIRKLDLDGPTGLAVFAVREHEAIRTLTILDSKQEIITKLKNDYR